MVTVETVETWADGYGRWHAAVVMTNSPKRDAQRARRAIIRELKARGTVNGRAVTVELERVNLHGTVVYRERDDTIAG